MLAGLEYHGYVRYSIQASLAVFGLLLVPAVFAPSSYAQINGAPASVTSPGFGGRAINGTPSSVTSLGPRGFAPNSRVTFLAPGTRRNPDHHPRHRRNHEPGFPLIYAVPVPYGVDNAATSGEVDAAPEENDQGGPTIFDRRGSGAASYVPPVRNISAPHAEQAASVPIGDSDPPEPTVLVFKDGRKLEVGNYAIVGATLFDLTPGHPRKIALAELDLDSTRQQNDDRGMNFHLPQAN